MHTMLPRAGALALAAILLTAPYNRTNSASADDRGGKPFSCLTPEQKGKATFKFDDAERMRWFFVPIERKGLPLREIASALLSADLSQFGLHEGGHDHEPGRRAAPDGEG
jgi:hypothetical protein